MSDERDASTKYMKCNVYQCLLIDSLSRESEELRNDVFKVSEACRFPGSTELVSPFAFWVLRFLGSSVLYAFSPFPLLSPFRMTVIHQFKVGH